LQKISGIIDGFSSFFVLHSSGSGSSSITGLTISLGRLPIALFRSCSYAPSAVLCARTSVSTMLLVITGFGSESFLGDISFSACVAVGVDIIF
jgi:hypothetical protein